MLPARNRKDFEDIPEEVRRELEFIWLERVEEAISSALEAKAPEAEIPGKSEASDKAVRQLSGVHA
jgi:ATP-dependent Lon protease